MLLYRTDRGPIVDHNNQFYAVAQDWNELVNDPALYDSLSQLVATSSPDDTLAQLAAAPLAPITDQEIWACGVTYLRSRAARMEEAQAAGGGDFYDRVYDAPRPELFFKATANRTVGPGESLHLRGDSSWIVPEPELTLVVTHDAQIVGYTIGNDLSCRDIEGENPLYLPQAKTFDRCAAVGPAILVSPEPLPSETEIQLAIRRGGQLAVEDRTNLAQMKRSLEELVSYLFRDNSHANGCLLMTGTGIVPPDDFSLQPGDEISITIEPIGTLTNTVH